MKKRIVAILFSIVLSSTFIIPTVAGWDDLKLISRLGNIQLVANFPSYFEVIKDGSHFIVDKKTLKLRPIVSKLWLGAANPTFPSEKRFFERIDIKRWFSYTFLNGDVLCTKQPLPDLFVPTKRPVVQKKGNPLLTLGTAVVASTVRSLYDAYQKNKAQEKAVVAIISGFNNIRETHKQRTASTVINGFQTTIRSK